MSWLFRRHFRSPIMGLLDVILVMGLTVGAIMFFGPIIIQKVPEAPEPEKIIVFDYMCEETGQVIKDFLVDEDGNEYGWIDITYHENGNFKEIIETNERDMIIKNVHYSEDGEFLYWYETKYDKNGDTISVIKYDQYGFEMEIN